MPEAEVTDSEQHVSGFNVAFIAAVLLAMAGWLWLIFYAADWAIGVYSAGAISCGPLDFSDPSGRP
jgi:hypothetical protein